MCLLAALLLAVGVLTVLKNRRSRTAVTAEGAQVTTAPVTEGEIKAALQENLISPPAALDAGILAAAEKELQGK